MIAGIDGCLGGWVVATRADVRVVARLELVDGWIVGVDMPIGLADCDRRSCDVAARRALGRRGSTVFPTPPRRCLDAIDWPDALRIARAASGRGISKQAFYLVRKIIEVDALVAEVGEERVIEVHPECSFATMNGGIPLPSKHTESGLELRQALLEPIFGPIPDPPRGARRDDVLDAFAVLWSTERWRDGAAVVFGDGERDRLGLVMRIVA